MQKKKKKKRSETKSKRDRGAWQGLLAASFLLYSECNSWTTVALTAHVLFGKQTKVLSSERNQRLFIVPSGLLRRYHVPTAKAHSFWSAEFGNRHPLSPGPLMPPTLAASPHPSPPASSQQVSNLSPRVPSLQHTRG